MSLENIESVLAGYTASCKVKLTIQRAAEISSLLSHEDQLLTPPPSILKILTGQVSKLLQSGKGGGGLYDLSLSTYT